MHCIAFIARYLDLLKFFMGGEQGGYLTWMKIYILIATITTVYTLLKARGSFSTHEARSILSQVLGTSLVCLLLASFFSYTTSLSFNVVPVVYVIETGWAFSVYLAAVADIPQLMEYDRMEKKDGLLTAYIVLCFAFRALHLPHWVLRYVSILILMLSNVAQLTLHYVYRYLDEGVFDVISISAGLVQTSIYIIYGFFIVLHHSRRQTIALDAECLVIVQNDIASPYVMFSYSSYDQS